MKTINIDEYLQQNGVEITLGEKSFTVIDVDEEVQDMIDKLQNDEAKPRDVVKAILRCEDKDLKPYGAAAFNAIINEVASNLFDAGNSQNDQ